tara:strand:+ start:59 stop:442 length:384 start_codon:yes stop_codon:yes gene_type:complete
MAYKDPEKRKEYMRLYRLKNKDKAKEAARLYYLKNQEQKNEYDKEYRQTPVGIKSNTISKWRTREVKDHFNDNFETLYRIYQSTKFCDDCGFELNTGDNSMRKCLDHCHKSRHFRGIVCMSCNIKRR